VLPHPCYLCGEKRLPFLVLAGHDVGMMNFPQIPLALFLISGFAAACFQAMGSSASLRSPMTLTDTQLERLEKALEPYHQQYDPDASMLKARFSSPGYHTTLTGGEVHRTRESLQYAVALMDTGNPEWKARAERILEKVISLQDQDPDSPTYGIWSWFLEEPLEKMSPPDWNWADFCGKSLVQIAIDHRDRLPGELQHKLDASIRHACASIKKRNVGPGYTNIAIMGTYVTMCAGELYGDPELQEYAMARLRRIDEHTRDNGAFSEYNSPTYTLVALKELARLRKDIQAPAAKPLIEDLFRTAWTEVTDHFHVPTWQWSGPHSRCYRTLLSPGVLSLIERNTSARVRFGGIEEDYDIEEHRLAMDCPRDLEHFFLELKEPRELVKTFIKGNPGVVGTNYHHPELSLGSINRGDFWNQRRGLVAYWGSRTSPSYLHLRCLHDGYDFSAAQLFCRQEENRVLAAANFATNGGDTHVSLDRLKEGRFAAEDLRFRFEFGGEAGLKDLVVEREGEDLASSFLIKASGMNLWIQSPASEFGDCDLRWETGGNSELKWLDLVVYEGAEKSFDLSKIERAFASFVLALSAGGLERSPGTGIVDEDGRLLLEWHGMTLSVPARPAEVSLLQRSVE
jgi:hypothetical protein